MKEILINKYMAGTSSREDERQLLALLQAEENPSADDLVLLSMLGMQAPPAEARDEWMEEDESGLFDRLMADQSHGEAPGGTVTLQPAIPVTQPPRRHVLPLVVRIMATAAILAGAFVLSRPLWQDAGEDMAVTYFYGNKVENSDLAMDMMHETMGDFFDRPSVESELSELFNQ